MVHASNIFQLVSGKIICTSLSIESLVAHGDLPVALIGSSRFKPLFQQIGEKLEKGGILCLSMSFFQHADGIFISNKSREKLELVDRMRIQHARSVLVVNGYAPYCSYCEEYMHDYPGHCKNQCAWNGDLFPYVGESTRKEIIYAYQMGIGVHYLNPSGDFVSIDDLSTIKL